MAMMKLNTIVLCVFLLSKVVFGLVCEEGTNGYENCDEGAVASTVQDAEKELDIPKDDNEDEKMKAVAKSLGIPLPPAKKKSKGEERSFGFGFPMGIEFPKCPVHVPMCYRTQCGGYVEEQSASRCLSNPACCFDKDLHLYRRVAGPGYMRGAPVCYHGATSVQYQQIAAMFSPWNAYFTEKIMEYFTSAFDTKLLHLGGNDLCYVNPYYAHTELTCGWPDIQDTECNLRGCCWTSKKQCIYPNPHAIAHYRQRNVYPELMATSTSEQTCSANPFMDPHLFRRLPCMKVNTKDSTSIRTCQSHCCIDAAALPKPPQPKYNPNPYNPYGPPPKPKKTKQRALSDGTGEEVEDDDSDDDTSEDETTNRSGGLFENKSPLVQMLLNRMLNKAIGGENKYGGGNPYKTDYEHHDTGSKYPDPSKGNYPYPPSGGNNYPYPLTSGGMYPPPPNHFPYPPAYGGNGYQQPPSTGYGYSQNPHGNSQYGSSQQPYGYPQPQTQGSYPGYGSGHYDPYSQKQGYPPYMGGGMQPYPMYPPKPPMPPKCPFIFKKIKGLPILSKAVKGCCKIHICYHKKVYIPKPSYVMGHWTPWSSCERTCGFDLGLKKRDRACINAKTRQPAQPQACQGSLTDTQRCPPGRPCPTNPPKFTPAPTYPPTKPYYPPVTQRQIQQKPTYQLSEWTLWSDCDQTCGNNPGTQTRIRSCLNSITRRPSPTPTSCNGGTLETKTCFSGKLCPTQAPKYAPAPHVTGQNANNYPAIPILPQASGPPQPYQQSQGNFRDPEMMPRSGDFVPVASEYALADEWLEWSDCVKSDSSNGCVQMRGRMCLDKNKQPVDPTLCGIDKTMEKRHCNCPSQIDPSQQNSIEDPIPPLTNEKNKAHTSIKNTPSGLPPNQHPKSPDNVATPKTTPQNGDPEARYRPAIKWLEWSDCTKKTDSSNECVRIRGRMCLDENKKQVDIRLCGIDQTIEEKSCNCPFQNDHSQSQQRSIDVPIPAANKKKETQTPNQSRNNNRGNPDLPPPGPPRPYQQPQGNIDTPEITPRSSDFEPVVVRYQPAKEWQSWSKCSKKTESSNNCVQIRVRHCYDVNKQQVAIMLCGMDETVEERPCVCPEQNFPIQSQQRSIEVPITEVANEKKETQTPNVPNQTTNNNRGNPNLPPPGPPLPYQQPQTHSSVGAIEITPRSGDFQPLDAKYHPAKEWFSWSICKKSDFSDECVEIRGRQCHDENKQSVDIMLCGIDQTVEERPCECPTQNSPSQSQQRSIEITIPAATNEKEDTQISNQNTNIDRGNPDLPPPGPPLPYQQPQGNVGTPAIIPRSGDFENKVAKYHPAEEWFSWSICKKSDFSDECVQIRGRQCHDENKQSVDIMLCGIDKTVEERPCDCPAQNDPSQSKERSIEAPIPAVADEQYEWSEYKRCAGECGKIGYKSRYRFCRVGEVSNDCNVQDSGRKICGGRLCRLDCPDGVVRIEKEKDDKCWLDPSIYYK